MNVLWMKDDRPFLFSSERPYSPGQAAEVAERLKAWEPGQVFVLDGPTEVRNYDVAPAGFTFTILFRDGPLSWLCFTIHMDSLALPPAFDLEGGRYVPLLGDDGGQMRTADGHPTYVWEAA